MAILGPLTSQTTADDFHSRPYVVMGIPPEEERGLLDEALYTLVPSVRFIADGIIAVLGLIFPRWVSELRDYNAAVCSISTIADVTIEQARKILPKEGWRARFEAIVLSDNPERYIIFNCIPRIDFHREWGRNVASHGESIFAQSGRYRDADSVKWPQDSGVMVRTLEPMTQEHQGLRFAEELVAELFERDLKGRKLPPKPSPPKPPPTRKIK